jgi:hypothetical protein
LELYTIEENRCIPKRIIFLEISATSGSRSELEERSSLAYYGSTSGGDGDIGQDRVGLASRRSRAGYGRGAWVRQVRKRVDHQGEKTHRKQGLVSVARDIIDSNAYSTLATADENGLFAVRCHQKKVDQDITVVIVECVG